MLVCNCAKLFRFDCVICGISLPVSFKSDCVLKCMLRRFAFAILSVHIVSLIFKGGIDDLSWVDINDFKVFHQSLLLILWFDFNLMASLSKYDFLMISAVW